MFKYTGEKKFLGRSVLAAAALVGLLGFAATPRAYADDEHCQKQIRKADHRLHEAIEDHGWNSRQAEHARHELREAREHCWNLTPRGWFVDGHRGLGDRAGDAHDHHRH